jgi:hypothetical protein
MAAKKQGAPLGNKNALKHGLYSSRVSHPAAPSLEDVSLMDEISLLRTLLDNYISTLPENFDISTLDTISAICLRISSIYKAHSVIIGYDHQDLTQIIAESIAEGTTDYETRN